MSKDTTGAEFTKLVSAIEVLATYLTPLVIFPDGSSRGGEPMRRIDFTDTDDLILQLSRTIT